MRALALGPWRPEADQMEVWGRSPHIWGLGPGTLEAEGRLMGGVEVGATHKIKLNLF